MGTSGRQTVEPHGMKKLRSRGEKEKGRFTEPRRYKFSPILFLVLFACFAVNSYSQDLDVIKANLTSGNTELKRNALYQIRVIRSEAASRLAVPLLSDANEIVRATAASSLIGLSESEIAVQLRPLLLNDRSAFVRREAAYALRDNRTGINTSALIKLMLEDKELEVRAAAATALGTSDILTVNWLKKVLEKKPNDDNEFLRRSATRSIGHIAELATSRNLSKSTPENFLPDKYKSGYSGKVDRSFVSQSPEFRQAVAILSKVLQNTREADDTRREAAFALGSIGDPSSAAILRSYLNSPDIYLAEICKEALIKLN